MPKIRIAIKTFDVRLNKNSEKLSRIQYGKSKGYKQVLDSFEILMRAEINSKGIRFEDKKTLDVSLFVYRPTKLHDPHNYVDEIFDIIKRATGVDDRYFRTKEVSAIDPEFPHDPYFYPHFEIELEQE